MRRVLQHSSENLSMLKSFQQQNLEHESSAFFREVLQLMKIPQLIRNKYYNNLELHQKALPENIFEITFPDFPFKLIAAPFNKSKEVTRLDHLEGKRGGEIGRFFFEQLARLENSLDGRALVMMARLPYFKNFHCVHNLDPNFINLMESPGNFYTLKSDKGFRVIIQSSEHLFTNPVISDYISQYLSRF